jgi:hypothetical protein
MGDREIAKWATDLIGGLLRLVLVAWLWDRVRQRVQMP